MHGPFLLSAQILIKVPASDGDDERDALITMDLPTGKVPTAESMQEHVATALAKAQEHFPNAYVASKQEFWDYVCVERTGMRFAMEGGSDWETVDAQ